MRIYEENRIQQAGRSYFSVLWEERIDYIKNIMETNECSCYLLAYFMECEGRVTVYYDDTGYMPLDQYFEVLEGKGQSLLKAVVGVLRRLAEDEEEAEDYLLNRDCVRFWPDCIFVCLATGKTALAHIVQGERHPFSRRVSGLLRELNTKYEAEGLGLLCDKLEEELQKGAQGTKDLLRLFSLWEREI